MLGCLVFSAFSAQTVALEVIGHLERRREILANDAAGVEAEIRRALVPMREEYLACELPPAYFDALERELVASLPAKWRAAAAPFTALEKRAFGAWREGDVVARLTYVFAGLTIGGLCVWLPFIPIWEKWFPFALATLGWWLPDAQARWHRRRYARRLGALVQQLGAAQPALDRYMTIQELSPPAQEPHD